MRHSPPVLWTKGVLLTPQHLQAQDRHHEETLAFQVDALAFSPWGLSHLSLDLAALAGGTLVTTTIAGRFADGLLFDAPIAGATPPPKALNGAFGPDQDTLLAYVAVPEYRPGARNVARRGESASARWQADEQLLRDETTGLTERPIQVSPPSLRLLLEGESLEGYTAMPIARLRRAASGDVTLDSQFVPPLLDLSASEVMMGMMRRLTERLSARSASLSGSRRQRNQGLADFTVADVGSFWLLYTVNTHLPAIRHLHEVRRGHPAALWEAMLALVGALSAFSTSGDARSLPTYDHLRLGEGFFELERRLYELLDGAVVDTAVASPLKPVRATLHAVAIEQVQWLEAPQWFLAVSAPLRQQELIPKVLQGCKVGAADVVDTLIRQALPGIELAHISSPPSAVPVKLDFQYFAIRKAGSAWDAIARARNLAVYVPAELVDARFELVIVLR
ncbi:type VI secretion system baseplate subunit TssK [Gemmatimonas sp.]|uniref:type VI secretion system baseplate subunit TssK n=1 Tax=Gemmatimonas sp. TaxID=1962908 RepID=UPI003562AD49